MISYPYYILLSVAHTEIGQDSNADKENQLSEAVVNELSVLLDEEGMEHEIIEIWGSKAEDGKSSLSQKVAEINRINAEKHQECLALEIHWNGQQAQSGTCVLHDKLSTKSKAIADRLLPILLDKLNRGQHFTGVIPFPSPYRMMALKFLRETKCPAVIIEVDSVRYYDEYYNNEWLIKKTANGIFEALKALG